MHRYNNNGNKKEQNNELNRNPCVRAQYLTVWILWGDFPWIFLSWICWGFSFRSKQWKFHISFVMAAVLDWLWPTHGNSGFCRPLLGKWFSLVSDTKYSLQYIDLNKLDVIRQNFSLLYYLFVVVVFFGARKLLPFSAMCDILPSLRDLFYFIFGIK